MMLFPGISQIKTAMIGMAFGALVAGVGGMVLQHRLDNGRYEALVAKQDQANIKALNDAYKQRDAFMSTLNTAVSKAASLQHQLNAERARKQTALHDVIVKEGKKDATLAACLGRQLPTDVLSNLPH